MNNVEKIFLVLLAFLVSACTSNFKPDVYPKFKSIQEFTSTASITLKNEQLSTTTVVYPKSGSRAA